MNIYQTLYDVIAQNVYAGEAMNANMELIATLTATWGTIAVIAVPFVVAYGLLKLIMR